MLDWQNSNQDKIFLMKALSRTVLLASLTLCGSLPSHAYEEPPSPVEGKLLYTKEGTLELRILTPPPEGKPFKKYIVTSLLIPNNVPEWTSIFKNYPDLRKIKTYNSDFKIESKEIFLTRKDFTLIPHLEEIQFPDNVVSIGENALGFSHCPEVQTIIPPLSLRTVGRCAFFFLYKLKELDFSKCQHLESLGEAAFCGCTLRSIRLPDSLTTIGNASFCGCRRLESVQIPSSVKAIGEEAFSGCAKLSFLDLSSCRAIKTIRKHTFHECSSLREIKLPPLLEAIEPEGIGFCAQLRMLTIPETVRQIGTLAVFNHGILKVVWMGDPNKVFKGQFCFAIGEKKHYYIDEGQEKEFLPKFKKQPSANEKA